VRADGRDERVPADAVSGELLRVSPVIEEDGAEVEPSSRSVVFTYQVSNSGQALMTALALWITDATGRVVSRPTGEEWLITPGGAPVYVTLTVAQPLPRGELTLWVKWVDGTGTQTRNTGIHPQPVPA
jgi:hypothetical protein